MPKNQDKERIQNVMLNCTGIDHPAVAVDDVDSMAEWYCDVLGYDKVCREDEPVWIIRAPDGSMLEVMPRDETDRPDRTLWTPGWSHLALRVEDLGEAIEWLESQNVNWQGDICDAMGGGRLRTFADPEGNIWQVVERQWGGE